MSAHDANLPAVDVKRGLWEIERAEAEESLAVFVRQAWHVVEPGNKYLHNWHIDFICHHLEALAEGVELDTGEVYNRLLVNVPPGAMKSMLVSVFWPAWIWGPLDQPSKRFLCTSHNQDLAVRDSTKMRRLIQSTWYQERWGDRVELTGDQNSKLKYENTATGFRQAAAFESLTGIRADFVIIDDPHSVDSASSDAMRTSTIETFLEAVPSRMTDPRRSVIAIIMQRLHQEDVAGVALDKNLGYDHICLPMRYEKWRDGVETKLGYSDPRVEEGELLFPARFPLEVVDRLERTMGPYATASQHQQTPAPRGGGVIKRDWWQPWQQDVYPEFDYIIAAVDTAFTTKTENDPSACVVFGVWSGGEGVAQATRSYGSAGNVVPIHERTYSQEPARVMMIYAWEERLELRDLVERVRETMTKYGVDKLLIENKASGPSVAQEIRRVFGYDEFAVQLIDPKGVDKLARLYSIQHLFSEGLIFAPDKQWAERVILQAETVPKSKHDDLVDCVSMALRYLRDTGLIIRPSEAQAEIQDSMRHRGAPLGALYPV